MNQDPSVALSYKLTINLDNQDDVNIEVKEVNVDCINIDICRLNESTIKALYKSTVNLVLPNCIQYVDNGIKFNVELTDTNKEDLSSNLTRTLSHLLSILIYNIYNNKDNVYNTITNKTKDNNLMLELNVEPKVYKSTNVGNVNKAPSFKSGIVKASELDPDVPYEGVSPHISAIWYWADQRFKRHKMDFVLNKLNFGLMAKKYSATILRTLGKEWESHKAFVDWYLSTNDDFIKNTCKYNFDYLCSTHAVNKYLNDVSTGQQFIDRDKLSTEELQELWKNQEK